MVTRRSAFSLVELSIVLAILGVLTAGGLSVGTTVVEQQANVASSAQLDEINKAIEDFYKVQGYLPCPARTDLALGDGNFGVPVNGGVCLAATGALAGTTTTAGVRIGALPTRALGLRDRSLADEFGNRYTYAVSEALTNATSFSTGAGVIVIRDGSTHPGNVIASDAAFAVTSHGSDGKGARRYQTATTPVACGADNAAGARDNENCDNDNSFRDTRFNNGGVAANFFDDFIRWMPKFRLSNTTAANSLWQLNGTSIYYNGGNVGIGTSTPGQRFTLEGAAPIAEIRTGGYLMLRPTANDWDMRLQAVAGNKLNIWSGGDLTNPIATFVHGGNVGIGTPTPGYRFQVQRPAGTNANFAAFITDGGGWVGVNPNASAAAWSSLPQNGDTALIFSQGSVDTGGFTVAQWSTNPRGFRIDANGNTGFGTAAPIARVDARINSAGGFALTAYNASSGFGCILGDRNIYSLRCDGVGRFSGLLSVNGDYNASYALTVNGNTIATNYFISSDERLKHDVAPLFATSALDVVDGINPVSFTWNKDDVKDIGVIAQDVEKVLPGAVMTDGDGFKQVAYDKLVLPALQAIKELRAENAALKARLDVLENDTPDAKQDAPISQTLWTLLALLVGAGVTYAALRGRR